jgi:hypothetical protein
MRGKKDFRGDNLKNEDFVRKPRINCRPSSNACAERDLCVNNLVKRSAAWEWSNLMKQLEMRV